MAGKRVREVRVAWGHKSISGIDTEQGYCINSGQRDSAWSVDCLGDDLGKTRCNINDVLSTSLVFESLLKAGIRDKTNARKRNRVETVGYVSTMSLPARGPLMHGVWL